MVSSTKLVSITIFPHLFCQIIRQKSFKVILFGPKIENIVIVLYLLLLSSVVVVVVVVAAVVVIVVVTLYIIMDVYMYVDRISMDIAHFVF